MKKSIIIGLFLLAIGASSLTAQDYHTSIGLRAGLSSGVTLKHFVSTYGAVEGILTTRWGGFNVTGLYEKHGRAFDTDNLYYFFGGGAHLGVWSGESRNPWVSSDNTLTVIGIDGIIGLEYVFT